MYNCYINLNAPFFFSSQYLSTIYCMYVLIHILSVDVEFYVVRVLYCKRNTNQNIDLVDPTLIYVTRCRVYMLCRIAWHLL